MSIHEPVDLARWIAAYDLDVHFQDLDAKSAPNFRYYQPADVFSPCDLAISEQMRSRARLSCEGSVAVDLLLPALGEPPVREASKVAGLPYRARVDWPVDRVGRPMAFLGQLCLADSRDLLPRATNLPGDVLLIFVELSGDMIWSEREGAALHFEWQRLGTAERDLASEQECPPGVWTPTHFQRLRSNDTPRCGTLRHREIGIEVSGTWWASKIGGLPAWQQGEEEARGLGKFFAALHSINPDTDAFPFPNVPTPPSDWETLSQGFFRLGDVGTLYLFWDGSRVRWLMQCG